MLSSNNHNSNRFIITILQGVQKSTAVTGHRMPHKKPKHISPLEIKYAFLIFDVEGVDTA